MGACTDPGPPLYNCKMLNIKVEYQKMSGLFSGSPPPPPKKKKKKKKSWIRVWEADYHALIPCMDLLLIK